jgi:ribosomal protein S11
MRRKKQNKKGKLKSKRLKNRLTKKKVTSTPLVKKQWLARKTTFSPYPYVLTISYHRKNVFFTIADIRGNTKGWLSSGRFGYKTKDKTTYMAMVNLTQLFVKKAWSLGVRRAILKFKNISKKSLRYAIRKALRKSRKLYPIKLIGFLFQIQIAFNGCRKKKKRRKA